MPRPRIIPVLLLSNGGLVKSIRFKSHRYIGDPINAVKIFNDLRADELVFLDIDATREGRSISTELVREIGEESNMPFSVGGGVRSIETIRALISSGAERVIIGSKAVEEPSFIHEAVSIFGSSTISVCIDVGRSFLKGQRVYSHNAKRSSIYKPEEFAQLMEKMGAGELIIQSIDRDGSMLGYDLELIASISRKVKVPVIALGGAGSTHDMMQANNVGYASGIAAGSYFVYQGSRRGVLINYLDEKELSSFNW